MWASEKIKKYAVIGTSCSGKTTAVYGILARLKQAGVSCDGVLQQDRRFSFDRDQLEKSKEAQYYFICNQIMRETELTLRGHAEVIVSDRSPLDLYSYYETMYGRSHQLHRFVTDWCDRTFKRMFLTAPLPYVDDKQRPSDEFRMQVWVVLKDLCRLHSELFVIEPNTEDSIFKAIMLDLGKMLNGKDLNIIPDIIGRDKGIPPSILVGGSYAFNRATKYSDLDLYILDYEMSTSDSYICKEQAAKIKSVLGIEVQVTHVPQRVFEYLKTQGFKEIKSEGNYQDGTKV
jgi:AAA domain/Nucleotidyltransferase domain